MQTRSGRSSRRGGKLRAMSASNSHNALSISEGTGKSKARGAPPPSASASRGLMLVRGSTTGYDHDLEEILHRLNQLEGRINTLLEALQKEIVSCCSFMLDAAVAPASNTIAHLKKSLPQVQKLRRATFSAEEQFNTVKELH